MNAPRRIRRTVAAALLLCWSGHAAAGSVASPDEGAYVNRPVPDTVVRTTDGAVALSDLWRRGPVVLTLVFTRCAGVCTPYLRALEAADEALGSPEDVQRVVVSFDARDTPDDMRRTAGHLGVAGRAGWTVGVAGREDLARLIEATGFWFTWDAEREQFDHPALLAGIRDGRIVRLLVGGSVNPARLGEVIREARGTFVASYPLPGDVRFRCFEYDPETGEAGLAAGALLLLTPAAGAAGATAALFRRGRRRRPLPAP